MLLDEKFLNDSTVDGRERLRESSDEALLGISDCGRGPVGHGHRVNRSSAGSDLAECRATQLVDPAK